MVVLLGLKLSYRRFRVVQLWISGYTQAQIAQMLKISERTIRRDVKSTVAEEFVRELQRRQFKDIEECEDPKTRMHYRDKMLNKLMPKNVNHKTPEGKAPIYLQKWGSEEDEVEDEKET